MYYHPEGTDPTLMKKFATAEEIRTAMESGEVMEGRVLLCDRDHNMHIDLGAMQGIIPYNEGAIGIIEGTVRDIALISKVNKPVCFRIKGFHRDENGKTVAVLSRRNVQISCLHDQISRLKCGDVIDAVVTHLEKFGAFIDIGAGINSLIPIDMLSVSRISHPSERLSEGQRIRCVLHRRDDEKLTFSLKELLGTWQENATRYNVGETVTGVVRSVEDYGIFVELAPNLAGLAERCDGVQVGQCVSVFIKSIMPHRMKVKLVIVGAFDMVQTPPPPEYFVTDYHIDRWQYSPSDAEKQIFTDYTPTDCGR